MSIGALPLGENALGAQQLTRSKSTKAPTRRQYVVKSDAAVTPGSTGGPVSAGRSYVVGERGPELFVPSTGGRIETARQSTRDVRVSIAVQTPAPGDPQVLRQSSRQVARAVRSALQQDRS